MTEPTDPVALQRQLEALRDAHPELDPLAALVLLAVVIGHIVGVTLAHDASLRILPKRHVLTGELALMMVMVLYTFLGLYLLFGA